MQFSQAYINRSLLYSQVNEIIKD
uniref:Uncharacterized protein n=1 Tax=Arundo donax TaxID=35708 RepID=A0A0A9PUT3_ARUDO